MCPVEQVEPAHAGDYRANGGEPRADREERPRRSRRTLVKTLVLLVVGMWIAFGIHGVMSYGHAYYKYRGFDPPKEAHGVSPGRLISVRFYSTALRQRRSFDVYLPPGYASEAAAGHRFPVLYLLHGSPGGASLFPDAADLGVDVDRMLARRQISPFLVAMPNGGDGSFRRDTEWANTPHGAYESFVLQVVQQMDSRFPTLARRRSRAIGGLSEGAYGAMNVALRHLNTFGIAESWSGYFIQERAGPFRHASLAAIAANSPATYVGSLARRLRRYPFHAYIYMGRHDKTAPGAAGFALELRRAGGRVTFEFVRGSHDWELWRKMMPRSLEYANRWFHSRTGWRRGGAAVRAHPGLVTT